jgi:hypothetical protein
MQGPGRDFFRSGVLLFLRNDGGYPPGAPWVFTYSA